MGQSQPDRSERLRRRRGRCGRDLPAPVEQVGQVFAAYEAAKVTDDGDRLFDFDDLLIYTTQILTDDAGLAEEFRSRYRCFVVDEYQDVTPVQHGLLKAWLGDRDDLTVVGDANQTIYTSPAHRRASCSTSLANTRKRRSCVWCGTTVPRPRSSTSPTE